MTKLWKTVIVTLLGLLVAHAPTNAEQAAPGATFVAATQNREALVAIVTSGDKTLAYVCDGEKVAEWYRGRAVAGAVNLTSTGGASKLEAKLDGGVWDGVITLEGDRRWTFRASSAAAPAGLYRSDDVINGARFLGGWVVLENGDQRGAVIGGGSTRPGAAFSARGKPTFSLAGVGSLLPFLVTPEFVDQVVE
jgi:hypothetical protein